MSTDSWSTPSRDLTRWSGPRGHPFHPILVTVPIGAFVSSLVFDILTWTRPGELPWLVDGAWWLIGVGLIGAGMAAVFGVVDLLQIPRGSRPWRVALAHSALQRAVLVSPQVDRPPVGQLLHDLRQGYVFLRFC